MQPRIEHDDLIIEGVYDVDEQQMNGLEVVMRAWVKSSLKVEGAIVKEEYL